MYQKLYCKVLGNSLAFILILLAASGCKKDFSQRLERGSSVSADMGKMTKPNIIFFVANDFGYEIPTYNGGESYQTPNLDYMAQNGVQFTQAYNHPDGSPSRMAILTGKYNFRNYLYWGYLPPTEKTIGNMLKDAGYSTYWVGKWQLGGGDQSIHNAGFDDYIAFLPFGHGQRQNRYKDPKLFVNNAFLPPNVVKGRYSEDMMFEYMSDFIDKNSKKPFYIQYNALLPATPWVPTPDDPEFKRWKSKFDDKLSDFKYFPSMVAYLDKIVGQTIEKIRAAGLENNTLIIFTSATQSYQKVVSQWRGQQVSGTKLSTNKFGTNMPIVAYWPGTIPAGFKSDAMIDFTDFLPTFADVAGIPVPNTYGTLDGVSFFDNFTQTTGKDRDWVFCHWDNNPTDNVPLERWVNDTTYKLYDLTGVGNGKFYNVSIDPLEKSPIPDDKMTQYEKQRKEAFKNVLSQMVK